MIVVELNDRDRARARRCATKRIDDARRSHAKDRFGVDSPEAHYWGALGELALARFLDIGWDCPSRQWAMCDVGRYEVRSISPLSRAYVKAKANDPLGRAVAVVRFTTDESATLLGWTTVRRIREQGTKEDPGGRGAPAYFLRDLTVLDPTFPERPTHLHGWARDPDGVWRCATCGERFEGMTPEGFQSGEPTEAHDGRLATVEQATE